MDGLRTACEVWLAATCFVALSISLVPLKSFPQSIITRLKLPVGRRCCKLWENEICQTSAVPHCSLSRDPPGANNKKNGTNAVDSLDQPRQSICTGWQIQGVDIGRGATRLPRAWQNLGGPAPPPACSIEMSLPLAEAISTKHFDYLISRVP